MPVILDQKDLDSKAARENSSQDPILKISNIKKGWQVAQVVQRHLPSKGKTLSTNPSTAKNKRNK
jgi:hypothetical protein